MHGARVGVLALLVAIASVLAPVRWQVAQAIDCVTEEAMFWYDWNTSNNSWRGGTIGQQGKIKTVNRQLASCPDYTHEAFSTQHFAINGQCCGDWVEEGWIEYPFNGQHLFFLFTEWGIDGDTMGYNEFFDISCLTPGTYSYYNIHEIGITDDWILRFACAGGPWTDTYTYYNTGADSGGVGVETGRRGGSGTNMTDSQIVLEYKDANGTYHDWTQPKCQTDHISGWKGTAPSPTSYSVVTGTLTCPLRLGRFRPRDYEQARPHVIRLPLPLESSRAGSDSGS